MANGKPNTNRTCVAPMVPILAIKPRCAALRMVWPIEPQIVNTAQRLPVVTILLFLTHDMPRNLPRNLLRKIDG